MIPLIFKRIWDYYFLKTIVPSTKAIIRHIADKVAWVWWYIILLLQFTTFGRNSMISLWDINLVVEVLFQLFLVHCPLKRIFLETQANTTCFELWYLKAHIIGIFSRVYYSLKAIVLLINQNKLVFLHLQLKNEHLYIIETIIFAHHFAQYKAPIFSHAILVATYHCDRICKQLFYICF
jgi:hypothetical protein